MDLDDIEKKLATRNENTHSRGEWYKEQDDDFILLSTKDNIALAVVITLAIVLFSTIGCLLLC